MLFAIDRGDFNMEKYIIMAGFGGQGVMLMGKLLCYAVHDSTDLDVTFFPSYGAEQRGGTANCYVAVADEAIGAPVTTAANDLIALNQPSLDRFVSQVVQGGTVFVNSSIVNRLPARGDLDIVAVPVTDLAIEMGSEKVLNIIMLGVYVGYTGILPEVVVRDVILGKLGKKQHLIAMNEAAFEKGLELGRQKKPKGVGSDG